MEGRPLDTEVTPARIEHDRFSYFGYGSLVNRSTLPASARADKAALPGYRRAWRAISDHAGRGVCSLSIEPAVGSSILGLVIEQPLEELGRLDDRESNYNRHVLTAGTVLDGVGVPISADVYVYRASARNNRWGDRFHPITLSYVDCVMQGFVREWGSAGIEHFVKTTDGWHVPIVDDRAAPRYPRAQSLTDHERALVGAALAAAGAAIVPLQDA